MFERTEIPKSERRREANFVSEQPEKNGHVDRVVPVAVFIPTYNRGRAVLSVLDKIQMCDPQPGEIWVHIDLDDGLLEKEIHARFPRVHILTSKSRVGPGGGRHRCLEACELPYA